MAEARTIAEVIAGEATYGTPEERWADMVAIASVIANRARQLGVSPQEVVANSGEFNAYGKSLPEGVNSDIVDMAQRAMSYVEDYGPVNDATFYSTPAAQDGLPSGLQEVNRTTGHVFSSDPMNRAIDTQNGYVTPSGETASRLMAPYDTSPSSQFGRLYGQQKAALTGGGLLSPYAAYDSSMTPGEQAIRGILTQPAIEAQPAQATDDYGLLGPQPLAEITTTPTGAKRPFAPDQTVTDNFQGAVTSILGPDAKATLTSGQEGGLAQFGSNRHKTGFAGDYTITDPTGHVLSWDNPNDVQVMKDIAQSAATQQANIGLGYDDHRMMHVDYVPESQFQPGQDFSWGIIGNEPEFAAKLLEARQTALMPDSFYEKANQRVLENNITPTLNSPQGFTQTMDGTGLMSELSPVATTPIERFSLPDVQPEAATNSFADAMAAQRTNLGPLNSPAMDSVRANVQRQIHNPSLTAPAPAGILSGQPTTSVGVGLLPSVAVNPTVPAETKPLPSYSEAMSSVPAQVPLETAMAMETPNFNQALNPSLPGLLSTPIGPSQYQMEQTQTMSAIPGVNAVASQPVVEGPTTTPAVDQQQTAQTQQAVTKQAVQAAKPSFVERLDKAMNPGTAIGGILGGAALGPLGGILGAVLGNKIYQGGGINMGSFGLTNQAPPMANYGYNPGMVSQITGGRAAPGSSAIASDGSRVSAQAGGDVARTNSFGVTDVANSYGGYSHDLSGWY